MKTISLLICSIIILSSSLVSCKKETIANRENLLLGTWDCTDYSDTISNKLKGVPPVFISNLYEKGYLFKKDNFMWTRNMDGGNKIYTDKEVDCEWFLLEGNTQLSLQFPDNMVEKYEIIELSRKTMSLKGIDGFWASNGMTYIFEKQ